MSVEIELNEINAIKREIVKEKDLNRVKKAKEESVKGVNNKKHESKEMKQQNLEQKRKKHCDKYEQDIEQNSAPPKTILDLVFEDDEAKLKYEKIRVYIQIIDVACCVLTMFILFLVLMDNQLIAQQYNILTKEFFISDFNNLLRYIIILFSLITVILILIRYNLKLDVHKIQTGSIANFDNFFNTKMIGPLIFEIIVNLIVIPPFYSEYLTLSGSIYDRYNFTKYLNNYDFDITYNGNDLNQTSDIDKTVNRTIFSPNYGADFAYFSEDALIFKDPKLANMADLVFSFSTILAFFNVLRIYHFVRVIYSFSYWTTLRSNSVCKLMNTSSSVSFGLKAYLKIYPLIALALGVGFLVVMFGIIIWVVEYYNDDMTDILTDDSSKKGSMLALKDLMNAFWLVIITMTTVGYGDMYPTNYFGRVLAIVSCICGTFVISLLVVFLNNIINFDDLEKTVYNTICERETQRGDLKPASYSIIRKVLLYNYLLNLPQNQGNRITLLYMLMEFRYSTREFKQLRFSEKTAEIDIEAILGSMKQNLEKGITPLNNQVKEFASKEKMLSHSFLALNKSINIIDKHLVNSFQAWNLLTVLNNDMYLKDLTDINEVYPKNANIIDEILLYHERVKLTPKRQAKKSGRLINIKFDDEEDSVEEIDNENDFKENNLDYEENSVNSRYMSNRQGDDRLNKNKNDETKDEIKGVNDLDDENDLFMESDMSNDVKINH